LLCCTAERLFFGESIERLFMMKRRSLSMLSGLFFFGALDGFSGATRPNILFIHVDDMDFDEIGCYDGAGKVLTPNMDSLARDGMKFTRAYTVSPVCVPSRYSTLTGRYPGHNKLLNETVPEDKTLSFENEDWSPRSGSFIEPGGGEKTIAHALDALGYVTGMVGKYHNDRQSLSRPYHDFGGDPHDPAVAKRVKDYYLETLARVKLETGFDVVDRLYWENKEAFPEALQFDNSPWVTEGAVNFIKANKKRPFFLYYSNPLPHSDCVNTWWKTHYNPMVQHNMEFPDPTATPEGFLANVPDIQPSRADVMDRCRAANTWGDSSSVMTWLDDSVGVLLNTLKEEGLEDNTMVILLSDHQSPGKRTLYDDGARIPFIIKWPGKIKPGQVNDQLVSTVDILPTLVKTAGGDPGKLEGVDGRDVTPLLADTRASVRDSLMLEIGFARGIVTKQYAYMAIRFPDDVHQTMETSDNVIWDGSTTRSSQTWFRQYHPGYSDPDQLYDLEKDPSQQVNLAGNPEYAPALFALKKSLSESLSGFTHPFGEFGGKQQKGEQRK
jgi:arylsulfatase A-like enzyme